MMLTEAVFGPDVNTGGWERLAYVLACDEDRYRILSVT
jgi:hypothetical protein